MTQPISALTAALQQINSMAAQAAGTAPVDGRLAGAAGQQGFGSLLKASLAKVSNDDQKSVGEAQAFELGSPNVSLNDVMVDSQKANLGLQFSLQVRNRLVSAYNDIMQMSV